MELISEFEIIYLNPIHHGYPAWPGGERWLQLYQVDTNTQAVFTKGLAKGKEYEVYLHTSDLLEAQEFSSSWQGNLVYEIGKILPNVQNLKERLELNVYLTVQIAMAGAPSDWALEDENGNIGLFIGLKNVKIEERVAPIMPLNIKLMRPDELFYCIQNGSEGRVKMAESYLRQGEVTISSLQRESVL